MIMRNITTFFLCLGMTFFQAYPFTTQKQYTKIRLSQQRRKDPCYRRQHRLQAKDSDGSEDSGIPQLPAIGASSFSTNSQSSSSSHNFQQASEGENQPTDAAFVSPKFELQYTCKVCDTRNCHLVSRIAYREGVVVAICKGCKSKHLIADNLGTAGLDGDTNIEDYFKARGMEDSVNRVTQEVFELEKILDFDSLSGSLFGEKGKPVLE